MAPARVSPSPIANPPGTAAIARSGHARATDVTARFPECAHSHGKKRKVARRGLASSLGDGNLTIIVVSVVCESAPNKISRMIFNDPVDTTSATPRGTEPPESLGDGRSSRGVCNRRNHREGRAADGPVCSPRWELARRSRVRRFRGARRPGVGAGAPKRHGRPPGSRSRASRRGRVRGDRTKRDARDRWEAFPRPRRPRAGRRASPRRPGTETSSETCRSPRTSAAAPGPPPPASGASGTETETNSWMTSPCSSPRRWRS